MPKAVDVNLDAAEMVLKLEKENAPRRIEYTRLDRLVKAKEPVRKLLRKVEADSIRVYVRGMEEPIVIDSVKVGDFGHVEEFLMKVAEKYDVAVER